MHRHRPSLISTDKHCRAGFFLEVPTYSSYVAACRLVLEAGRCNICRTNSSVLVWILLMWRTQVAHTTALCPTPALYFLLLPLCLHDRSLPWSAALSSCNRSRNSIRTSPPTIPLSTKKRIQFNPVLPLQQSSLLDFRLELANQCLQTCLYVNYCSHFLKLNFCFTS